MASRDYDAKKLIMDIYGSYSEMTDMISDPIDTPQAGAQQQPADALAAAAPPGGAPPAPGGEAPAPAPEEGAV